MEKTIERRLKTLQEKQSKEEYTKTLLQHEKVVKLLDILVCLKMLQLLQAVVNFCSSYRAFSSKK